MCSTLLLLARSSPASEGNNERSVFSFSADVSLFSTMCVTKTSFYLGRARVLYQTPETAETQLGSTGTPDNADATDIPKQEQAPQAAQPMEY
jgi:hypothetical protein